MVRVVIAHELQNFFIWEIAFKHEICWPSFNLSFFTSFYRLVKFSASATGLGLFCDGGVASQHKLDKS